MQITSRKLFQNILPPPPPRVSSKRQWKKYFIFKMYHTFCITCWIVPEIAKKSKSWQNIDSWGVSVASVKNILDQHFGSGGSAWGACHHQPQFFEGKNSFHEWKKLHFQEQSLTLMLTVTDIHSTVTTEI